MPVAGLAVLSRSMAQSPPTSPHHRAPHPNKSSDNTYAMTSRASTQQQSHGRSARACASENWVGINKSDLYSIFDKIYQAETKEDVKPDAVTSAAPLDLSKASDVSHSSAATTKRDDATSGATKGDLKKCSKDVLAESARSAPACGGGSGSEKKAAKARQQSTRHDSKPKRDGRSTASKSERRRKTSQNSPRTGRKSYVNKDVTPSLSPKECWVPVNKNMVENLVENLFNTSGHLQHESRTNDSCSAATHDDVSSNDTGGSCDDVSVASNETGASASSDENEIDVENVDVTVTSPTPRHDYVTSVACNNKRRFSQTQHHLSPPSPEVVEVPPSDSINPLKRKTPERDVVPTSAAAFYVNPTAAACPPPLLDLPTSASLDRVWTGSAQDSSSRAKSEPKEQVSAATAMAAAASLDASLRAHLLLSMTYEPLVMRHLQTNMALEQAGLYAQNPAEHNKDETLKIPAHQTAPKHYSPPPRDVTRVHTPLTRTPVQPEQEAATSRPAAHATDPVRARRSKKKVSEKTVNRKEAAHPAVGTAMAGKQNGGRGGSPTLGWVAVSKRDVHTIVDSVMNSMILNDIEEGEGDSTKSRGTASVEEGGYSIQDVSRFVEKEEKRKNNASDLKQFKQQQQQQQQQQHCDSTPAKQPEAHDVTTLHNRPPSLSSLSDISGRSSPNSSPAGSGTVPGNPEESPSSVSTGSVRPFKWKKCLLKRARQEGEDDEISDDVMHNHDAASNVSAGQQPSRRGTHK